MFVTNILSFFIECQPFDLAMNAIRTELHRSCQKLYESSIKIGYESPAKIRYGSRVEKVKTESSIYESPVYFSLQVVTPSPAFRNDKRYKTENTTGWSSDMNKILCRHFY